jgi:hypothetical protein
MKFLFKEVDVFRRKISIVHLLWFALAFIAVILEVSRSSINNYLVFKYVFWHVIEQKNAYAPYPSLYNDINHYGPIFSLIIAPFAVLPDWLGCILWSIANAWILFYAIQKLDLSKEKQLIILAITAIEMMTATHSVQSNPMSAAWIILAYALVEKEKDFWATLFIVAGFLVKLYGIGALLFFVFSKHKVRFILSFIFWMSVLFCLPMLYSSPSYIISSYQNWLQGLVEKNAQNAGGVATGGLYQDVSVMGMVRRISNNPAVSNIIFLVPAALLVVAPLLRFKQYASEAFRLSYLAIVLITVVVFSSSAESSTYVIAVSGVSIWYILNYKEHRRWSNILLVFVFLLTILSPTDLIPSFIRYPIRTYSLKALPCFIVWVWLIADVIFKKFSSTASTNLHR